MSEDQFWRELGRMMARRRKEIGANQGALALAMGIPRSGISLIESGDRKLTYWEALCFMRMLSWEPPKDFLPAVGEEARRRFKVADTEHRISVLQRKRERMLAREGEE
jgi:transcriptional regulator with XRE-family HTH domain